MEEEHRNVLIIPNLEDDFLFHAVQKYFFLDENIDFDYIVEDDGVIEDSDEENEFEEDGQLNASPASTNTNIPSSESYENLSTSTVVELKVKKKRIYKKRKRVRKKDPFHIPRLLKRDLRRQFPLMMVNVFNSHDFPLIRSFFLTFGSRDIVLKKNPLTLEFKTNNRNNELFHVKDDGQWMLSGAQWIIYHWYILSRINPDQVIRLEETTIHTSSVSSKSKISFVIEVDFTRIYDIEDDKFVDNIFNFLRSLEASHQPSIQPDSAMSQTRNFLDPFDYYMRKTGASMPLLVTPQSIRMRAKAAYYFDEEKHIEMVEIADAAIAL